MRQVFVAALLTVFLTACASMGGAPMGAKFENGVLVNSAGMTLYTFDKDVADSGKSMCNGFCAKNWPPLSAGEYAHASGDWSVITRNDGTKQWAYKGKPLYLFIKDHKPGDMTGNGFKNVWHVARR